jgi:retinol dehydrogenase-12
MAARFGGIDLDRLDPGPTSYESKKVYEASKLMQVVFSRELNEWLQGTGVTSNSLEPGMVKTGVAAGMTLPLLDRPLGGQAASVIEAR